MNIIEFLAILDGCAMNILELLAILDGCVMNIIEFLAISDHRRVMIWLLIPLFTAAIRLLLLWQFDRYESRGPHVAR